MSERKKTKTILEIRIALTDDVTLPNFADILREIANAVESKHLSSHGECLDPSLVGWCVYLPDTSPNKNGFKTGG